jgi:hypothetical protein
MDRIEAELQAEGARPAPVKRTGDEHFRWLARYQVLGESFTVIARDACKERQTVTDATKETAALVHLELRPAGRPGRKKMGTSQSRIVRTGRPWQ